MTEPRIEHKDKFLAVGTRYFGKNENGEIGVMWKNDFLPRLNEIDADPSHGCVSYGICHCTNSPEGFEYLAALAAKSLDSIPEGMVGWEIAENTYAVFTSHGLAELGGLYNAVYNEWFPNSQEYERAEGYVFELYPETYNSDESTLYLYFPIKKKA